LCRQRRHPPAGAGPGHLGVRHDRLPSRMAAGRDRRARATRDVRLSHGDPRPADVDRILDLDLDGRLAEAIEAARESGLDQLMVDINAWYTRYPGRPDYFTHWGEAFKYAASVVGLPIGDYPHGRPPQALLPDEAKAQLRSAFEKAGLAQQPAHV